MPAPVSAEQKREWKERVLQQKESGQNLSKWCKEHQVNYDSMLYWRKKLGFVQTKPVERSSFKELPVTLDTSAITLEYQRIQVHLPKNCNPTTLVQYLQALKDQP